MISNRSVRTLSVAVWTLAVLLTAGCATPQSSGTRAVESGFPPLSPRTLGADRSAQQVLRAAFANQELTLTTVVNVQGDELRVIGVTATGQRVFAVQLTGTQVTVDARDSATSLPPKQLLSDLQLSYWPLTELRRALAGSAWRVKEVEPHTRRLYRDDKLVAEVHYSDADPWNGRFWLVNFQFGYSLAIESRPLTAN